MMMPIPAQLLPRTQHGGAATRPARTVEHGGRAAMEASRALSVYVWMGPDPAILASTALQEAAPAKLHRYRAL